MEKRRKNNEKLKNPPARDLNDLASSNDCTGLTPSAVKSEIEAESYDDMMPIPKPKPSKL